MEEVDVWHLETQYLLRAVSDAWLSVLCRLFAFGFVRLDKFFSNESLYIRPKEQNKVISKVVSLICAPWHKRGEK